MDFDAEGEYHSFSARFEDSTILSELIYSSANLLVLLNDAVLRKAANVKLSLVIFIVFASRQVSLGRLSSMCTWF